MGIPSTSEWREAIQKPFRYSGHLRAYVDLMSTVSKSVIQASSDATDELTNVYSTIDNKTDSYKKAATMEGFWKADGSCYLLSRVTSENYPLPWWSKSALNTPVVLSYDFGGNKTSFIGVTVIWDTQYNTWPVSVTVIGKDSNGSPISEYTITDISSSRSVLAAPMDNIYSLDIVINEWNSTGVRARVTEVYFGVSIEFSDTDIIECTEKQKIDLMSEELPTATLDLKLRNQIYRATKAFGVVGVTARSHPLTEISRIFNGVTQNEGAIATVEQRYWSGSGQLFLPSRKALENLTMPWMSDTSSISSENPVDIIITYDPPVAVNQLNIIWDNVTFSFPTDFQVTCYDDVENIIFDKAYAASSAQSMLQEEFGTVKQLVLSIRAWSQKGWRARITQFETLFSYGNNLIPSQVNNLFDPTLETGYSKYLAQRQRMRVQYGLELTYGEIEWLSEQIKYISGWNIPTDKNEVVLYCDTQLSFLSNTFFYGDYIEDRTFYNMALTILSKSNVIKSSVDEIPWELAESLKDFRTSAPIPAEAANVLLQLIAGATGHIMDTNPLNGYIRIRSDTDTSSYSLTPSVQQGQLGVKGNEQLRSIVINVYQYYVEDEETELVNTSVQISQTQVVKVTYKKDTLATNCKSSVSGATLIAAEYYNNCAFLTLQADGNALVGIVVTGKVIENSTTAFELFNDPLVESGLDIEIDNPLITSLEVAQNLAISIKDHYSTKQNMTVPYQGYPDMQAGDKVGLYSTYINGLCVVTESSFSYNGGFSGTVVASLVSNENQGSGILPRGYTQLQYIESTGSQYIDTGVLPTQDTLLELDIRISTDSAKETYPFGSYGATNRFFTKYSSGSLQSGLGVTWFKPTSYSGSLFDLLHIELGKGKFIVEDSSVFLTSSDFTVEQSILLFGLNSKGDKSGSISAAIYRCTIHSADVVIRDFIPCKNFFGVVGLYDIIQRKFYSNNGSGSFIAGPVVQQ